MSWRGWFRLGHNFIAGHDQRTGCGNPGVQLSERTRGGVTWIGKGVVASLGDASIQHLEIVEAHIDFAPQGQMVGEADLGLQLQW